MLLSAGLQAAVRPETVPTFKGLIFERYGKGGEGSKDV